MATYARIRLSGVGATPLRCWRNGEKTITFGMLGDGRFWYVQRSDWPWAAVFPAVSERAACEFGDRLLLGEPWTEVPVGELASADA